MLWQFRLKRVMLGVGVRFHRLVKPLCVRVLCKATRRLTSTLQSNGIKITEATHRKSANDLPYDSLSGKYFSDHMLCCRYNKHAGWDTPEIIPYGDISVSPANYGLQYAMKCFEGMCAFFGTDGKVRLFRPFESMKQLNMSAIVVGLQEFDVKEYITCVKKLIKLDKEFVPKRENCSLYVHSTYIGTDQQLVAYQMSETALLYCITSPMGPSTVEPISLVADPKRIRVLKGAVGSDANIGRNYVPYLQWNKANSDDQVLWLTGASNHLTEVGALNNVFVHWINEFGESEIATPPIDAGDVYPGVLRKSLIELGSSWKTYQIAERQISMNDIKQAVKENRMKEMFVTEMAQVIKPVKKIKFAHETIEIPTMETGAVFRRFHKELTDIQYGYLEHDWCEIVD